MGQDRQVDASGPEFAVRLDSDGARPQVIVAGEIDLSTAPTLESVLHAALAGAREVHVDMAEVTFIDSAGLAVLLDAQQLADAEGVVLVLCHPRDQVLRVFQLADVRDCFTISDDSPGG